MDIITCVLKYVRLVNPATFKGGGVFLTPPKQFISNILKTANAFKTSFRDIVDVSFAVIFVKKIYRPILTTKVKTSLVLKKLIIHIIIGKRR